MNKRLIVILLVTHAAVGAFGFMLGIYVLPILTAPPAPSAGDIASMSSQSQFTAEFNRDRQDSDAFHWGEGKVSIGRDYVTLMGKLAPGPDYKLYLSPEFVETEADFLRLKPSMTRVGNVTTFENFAVKVPADVNPADYTSVIVWCEAFGQFITSAKYQ